MTESVRRHHQFKGVKISQNVFFDPAMQSTSAEFIYKLIGCQTNGFGGES